LVQLVGWSQKRDSFLLVYEYMPNGSLDYHLLCMHCIIWRNAAHPVMLLWPEDLLDLDEHELHNLDWDSIIKELGLHEDPGHGPTLKSVLQFNPCEPQVRHHLPELAPTLPAFRSLLVCSPSYCRRARRVRRRKQADQRKTLVVRSRAKDQTPGRLHTLSHLRSTIFQSCQIHRR
jgi:hypothetical protein